jgi:microcystin-dependent protein
MDQYLGSIWAFAFNFNPVGWQQCNGQILNIQSNAALFALLGTIYGGNGTSTFALPDLRGRIAIGWGQGPGLQNYNIGQVGGTENLTLTVANLPQHTHAVNPSPVPAIPAVSNKTGSQASPVNNYFSTATHNGYSTTAGSNQTMAATTGQSGVAGSSTPIPLKNPYQVLNYCIATSGAFPSRN